jgi:hypothetical protein
MFSCAHLSRLGSCSLRILISNLSKQLLFPTLPPHTNLILSKLLTVLLRPSGLLSSNPTSLLRIKLFHNPTLPTTQPSLRCKASLPSKATNNLTKPLPTQVDLPDLSTKEGPVDLSLPDQVPPNPLAYPTTLPCPSSLLKEAFLPPNVSVSTSRVLRVEQEDGIGMIGEVRREEDLWDREEEGEGTVLVPLSEGRWTRASTPCPLEGDRCTLVLESIEAGASTSEGPMTGEMEWEWAREEGEEALTLTEWIEEEDRFVVGGEEVAEDTETTATRSRMETLEEALRAEVEAEVCRDSVHHLRSVEEERWLREEIEVASEGAEVRLSSIFLPTGLNQSADSSRLTCLF